MSLFNLHFRQKRREEALAIEQPPQPLGNTIILLHHDHDRELWCDLAPHLNLLIIRLGDAFQWRQYLYATLTAESGHEAFIKDLQSGLLFVPCTSTELLAQFTQHSRKDPRMSEALAHIYVQPIPLRATHGVTQSILPQPLAAYEKGHAREAACVQIVQALETKLLQRSKQEPQQASIVIQESRRLLPTSSR